MKILIFAFLLVSIILNAAAFAKKPAVTPEQILQRYDFNNAKDRYRWYQDVRNHLARNGGIQCKPGTSLKIDKDGTFSVDKQIQLLKDGTILLTPADSQCLSSVKPLKKFPLPYNYPSDNIIFPVRDGRQAPMTNLELDTTVFKRPLSEYVKLPAEAKQPEALPGQ